MKEINGDGKSRLQNRDQTLLLLLFRVAWWSTRAAILLAIRRLGFFSLGSGVFRLHICARALVFLISVNVIKAHKYDYCALLIQSRLWWAKNPQIILHVLPRKHHRKLSVGDVIFCLQFVVEKIFSDFIKLQEMHNIEQLLNSVFTWYRGLSSLSLRYPPQLSFST